jgi:hypothetical protein
MPKKKMIELKTINDFPVFESEAEEAEYWSNHEVSDAVRDQAERDSQALAMLAALPTRRSRADQKSNPTSIRLGADLEKRLRQLAELKHTSYQTLLKEFVLERVYEEEKRLKIV